ncbi:MAG TPA: phage/plasmid replication protein, II/X family [Pseudomonadales bacterium]|nr:phage/plasmid replication protein, II/X family [Pseudomonadales bacterium]
MMIDWVTAKTAFHAPMVISGGSFMSINPDGTIEYETPKRMQLRGSHDGSMTVRTTLVDHQGHTEQIELSGNPVKFLQGHNVWGSDDLPNLVAETLMKVSSLLNIKQPASTLERLPSGTLSRTDLNRMYDLGSRENVLAYLNHLAKNSRTRTQSAITRGSTVYHNKTSRRWSAKSYSKGQEVELARNNKQGSIALPPSVIAYADTMLRNEITLKSNELRHAQLHTIGAWNTVDCESVFEDYYGRITMPDQEIMLIPADLPSSVRLTYVSWKEGHDLRTLLSRPTYYRHRKQLLEHGIDISIPSGKVQPDQTNVTPFIRTITLKPASIPRWAYGTDLLFEPRKLCKF